MYVNLTLFLCAHCQNFPPNFKLLKGRAIPVFWTPKAESTSPSTHRSQSDLYKTSHIRPLFAQNCQRLPISFRTMSKVLPMACTRLPPSGPTCPLLLSLSPSLTQLQPNRLPCHFPNTACATLILPLIPASGQTFPCQGFFSCPPEPHSLPPLSITRIPPVIPCCCSLHHLS